MIPQMKTTGKDHHFFNFQIYRTLYGNLKPIFLSQNYEVTHKFPHLLVKVQNKVLQGL